MAAPVSETAGSSPAGPPAPHAPRRPLAPEVLRALEGLDLSARYRLLFHGTSAGVFFGILGGQLIEANAAFARMFGYADPGEMAGLDSAELYWDAEDRAVILDEAVGSDQIREREVRFRRRDGSMGWGLAAGGILEPVPGVRCVQGTMLDISARKLDEVRLEVAAEERRELLARIFTAEEDERRRLAAELHDDSLQLLAAAQMHLHRLRPDADPVGAAAVADQARRLVEEAQNRLRSLLSGLRPTVLDDQGLAPGLRVSMSELLDEGTEWSLADELDAEPDPETAVVVYRIGQEALANVRKHANASHVEVRVVTAEGGISIRVQDDGAGFSHEQVNRLQVGHLGLRTMRERAETAGGWMRMQSRPGGGTVVEAWVPAEGNR